MNRSKKIQTETVLAMTPSPESKAIAEQIDFEKKRIKHIEKQIEEQKRSLENRGIKSDDENDFVVPLNEEELAIVEQHKELKKKFPDSPIRIRSKMDDNGNFLSHAYENKEGYPISGSEKFALWSAALTAATGTTHQGLSSRLFSLCASAAGNSQSDDFSGQELTNILNAMQALKPQDEVEGMLISRLVSLHYQSMKYLACTCLEEQTSQGIEVNINRSTKLFRIYNETLEALMRYRRKGEQKVVVQHVQVNDGGQAIVADTMIASRGGGFSKK